MRLLVIATSSGAIVKLRKYLESLPGDIYFLHREGVQLLLENKGAGAISWRKNAGIRLVWSIEKNLNEVWSIAWPDKLVVFDLAQSPFANGLTEKSREKRVPVEYKFLCPRPYLRKSTASYLIHPLRSFTLRSFIGRVVTIFSLWRSQIPVKFASFSKSSDPYLLVDRPYGTSYIGRGQTHPKAALITSQIVFAIGGGELSQVQLEALEKFLARCASNFDVVIKPRPNGFIPKYALDCGIKTFSGEDAIESYDLSGVLIMSIASTSAFTVPTRANMTLASALLQIEKNHLAAQKNYVTACRRLGLTHNKIYQPSSFTEAFAILKTELQ